jgi:uncharacterized protein YcfL
MKAPIALFVVVAGSLAFGCAPIGESVEATGQMVMYAHVGGAYKPVNRTKYDLENQEPVVLMDKRVEHSITIAGIEQTTAPDGRLRVIANFRNRVNHRIEMQVSCVFKDEKGFSTSDETPWQTLIVTEHAQETASFVAMNAQGKRATIRVRQAR